MSSHAPASQLLLFETAPVAPTLARRPRPRTLESSDCFEQAEIQFPPPRQPEARRLVLEHQLRVAMGRGPIFLEVTDNRRTMLSERVTLGDRRIRVHHMFLDAPPAIIAALGRYFLRRDRLASRLIDQFIASNQHRVRSSPPTPVESIVAQGRHHDLAQIQDVLSERYFEGAVRLPITWGRFAHLRRRRRSRNTIRMGIYLLEEQLIRIHPALDQEFVPKYFVESVVYHEMLHHVVPMPTIAGRRVYHSDEFRRRERMFEHHDRVRDWERRNLGRLIGSRAP